MLSNLRHQLPVHQEQNDRTTNVLRSKDLAANPSAWIVCHIAAYRVPGRSQLSSPVCGYTAGVQGVGTSTRSGKWDVEAGATVCGEAPREVVGTL